MKATSIVTYFLGSFESTTWLSTWGQTTASTMYRRTLVGCRLRLREAAGGPHIQLPLCLGSYGKTIICTMPNVMLYITA